MYVYDQHGVHENDWRYLVKNLQNKKIKKKNYHI